MRDNSPKQRCPDLRYPTAGIASQLLVIKDVLSSNLARGFSDDFPFRKPERTSQSYCCSSATREI